MIYVLILVAALIVGYFIGRLLKRPKKVAKVVNVATKLVVIALIIVVGSKFGSSGIFREGIEILITSGFIALLSSILAVIISMTLIYVLTRRSDML